MIATYAGATGFLFQGMLLDQLTFAMNRLGCLPTVVELADYLVPRLLQRLYVTIKVISFSCEQCITAVVTATKSLKILPKVRTCNNCKKRCIVKVRSYSSSTGWSTRMWLSVGRLPSSFKLSLKGARMDPSWNLSSGPLSVL